MRRLVPFFAGLTFAAGLCLSGMTRTAKVIGFLDVTGRWDPSLAFVMVGAIAVSVVAFRLAARRRAPLWAARFELPDTRRPIDAPLILGASLFGVGWGLAGICPGPALVGLASGQPGAIVFALSMLAGIGISGLARRETPTRATPSS